MQGTPAGGRRAGPGDRPEPLHHDRGPGRCGSPRPREVGGQLGGVEMGRLRFVARVSPSRPPWLAILPYRPVSERDTSRIGRIMKTASRIRAQRGIMSPVLATAIAAMLLAPDWAVDHNVPGETRSLSCTSSALTARTQSSS